MDLLGKPQQMGRGLLRRVVAGKAERGLHALTNPIADKTHACGLGLKFGIFAHKNNVGHFAPPQAGSGAHYGFSFAL
jgi:hypothetical protein